MHTQKHEQGFGATSTQPVCMLDDATVHIEDAASCAYRYTTATRLDMYSTTHRCVELALSGLVLQKQIRSKVCAAVA